MEESFFKALRSREHIVLHKHPYEYTLLSNIAFRAKRINNFDATELEVGEALIGDFKAIGLTRQKYRTALKNLVKWGLVTKRTTNRGTIAKLINSRIFDINPTPPNEPFPQQSPITQPSKNHQETTKKTEKHLPEEKDVTSDENNSDGIDVFEKLKQLLPQKHYDNYLQKQLKWCLNELGEKETELRIKQVLCQKNSSQKLFMFALNPKKDFSCDKRLIAKNEQRKELQLKQEQEKVHCIEEKQIAVDAYCKRGEDLRKIQQTLGKNEYLNLQKKVGASIILQNGNLTPTIFDLKRLLKGPTFEQKLIEVFKSKLNTKDKIRAFVPTKELFSGFTQNTTNLGGKHV